MKGEPMKIEDVKVGQRVSYPTQAWKNDSGWRQELYYKIKKDFGTVEKVQERDEWLSFDVEDGLNVLWDSTGKVEPVSVSAVDLVSDSK